MRISMKVSLAVVVMLVVCAHVATSAFAGAGYVPAGSFGAKGTENGKLSEPAGIAVNDSKNSPTNPQGEDVYVYDAGNRRVEWFNSTGSQFEGLFDGSTSPTGQFAPPAAAPEHGTLYDIAIDNGPSSPSAGDVYVVDPGHNVIDKFSSTGAYVSRLTGFSGTVLGVAVDSSGDVWVALAGEPAPVEQFNSALQNKLITTIDPEFGRSPGIAVDSEQNIYLLRGEPNAAKFSKEGAILDEQITTCSCLTGIAVDATTNELFTDQGSSIGTYPTSGGPYFNSSPVETLGVSSSYGVAVNGASHRLYATQREADTVAMFELVSLPDVTTGSAHAERASTKLEGEVNPGGEAVTSCEFEYGTSTSYGQTAPCTPPPGSGTSPVAVSAEITGLATQTTYHYRLLAHNAHGPRAGADQEFPTPVAVEGVLTGQASNVQATTATLNGSLEPNGFDTHYFFEYGTSEAYGSSTASTDAGSAKEAKPLSATIQGLVPHQEYHYRLVGENAFGKTRGEDKTLTTAALAPLIVGAPSVSFLGSQSADLNASLNPEHLTTRYHYEYGACPTLTGCTAIDSSNDETSTVYGTTGAIQEITGLAASTTYSYRLVAGNRQIASCEGGYPVEEEGMIIRCEEGGVPVYEGGEATGQEGSFTTAPAAVPSLSTGAASAITTTSATVAGSVDPDGQPATYTFELGVYQGAGTHYGVLFTGPVAASTTAVPETFALTGLQPGTVYAYRIAVKSGYTPGGQPIYGQPALFTTEGLPAVLASPPVEGLLTVPAISFPTGSLANTANQPAIKVLHHSVQGNTATLAVSVPSAGKLTASARDLSRASGKASRAGTIKVKLTLTKAGQTLLSKHPGRKLQAKVTLTFTPKKGPKLKTSVTVLVG